MGQPPVLTSPTQNYSKNNAVESMMGIGNVLKYQFMAPGERARSWQLIRFRRFRRDETWEKLSIALTTELQGENSKYVIAEASNGHLIGNAGAELRTLGAAFAPKRTLHISVVYVLPR